LPELDGQVHHDTHALPMGNYVIEVGKSLINSASQVGNYKIADKSHAHVTGCWMLASQVRQPGGRRGSYRAHESGVGGGRRRSQVTRVRNREGRTDLDLLATDPLKAVGLRNRGYINWTAYALEAPVGE
jgi:hypothetical protein